MIDINKKYRTRDGREVRIYATDGLDEPIHGAIKSDKGWVSTSWFKNGRWLSHGGESGSDLIEVRPRHKRTVWVNAYDDTKATAHLSREEADLYLFERIACIKVELDFEEGEGL